MSHTPGPWFYATAQDGQPYRPSMEDFLNFVKDCWSISEGEGWGAVLCEDGGKVVCLFGNGPNTEANARLIAAAPDLLEALEEMLEEFSSLAYTSDSGQTCYHEHTPEMLEAMQAAKAAIAKAKGGSE